MDFVRTRKKNLAISWIIVLAVISFISTFIFKSILTAEINLEGKFHQIPISLNNYDLHDLGVVDLNGDDLIDIFTTNHSALQSILINESTGKFSDRLIEENLQQDSVFPGLEISAKAVKIDSPGIYFYREKNFRLSSQSPDNHLVIKTHRINRESLPIRGTLSLSSAVTLKKNKNFKIDIDESKLSSGGIQTKIFFDVLGNGELVLESLTAIPVEVNMNPQIPLDLIYIGSSKLTPSTPNFKLSWKDRHGMAWADYDSDSNLDVYISRGGLKGKIVEAPELYSAPFFNDELLRGETDGFSDQALQAGVYKKACPGRQTSWVDFDGDGKLDLYTVCGRGSPPAETSPNQLYHQTDNQQFVDVAHDVGLDFPETGIFVWLDVDNNNTLDFFWVSKSSFQLFLNSDGHLKPQPKISNKNGFPNSLSIYDFDSDGLLDILVISGPGCSLLKNQGEGIYKSIRLSSLGLPNRVLEATWVDYNNDGLIDLHTIPNGLYQQQQDHTFKPTNILEVKTHLSKLVGAQSTWFDFDNDGSRDLLMFLKYRPFWLRLLDKLPGFDIPNPRSTNVKLYKNLTHNNNWLQIKLLGKNGNKQAVGAAVIIESSDGTKQLHQVGESEGSHYSQGHYRLYIGLGKQERVNSVKVFWPDGQTKDIDTVPINHLLHIEQTA
ncbi:CRTAC1 family protein [Leptothoe spongobia]|uniref:CRTAC1 family protein n=1 Tax=Leptothoe spongobia TAU-MAC 1115 TaxID=1967444 RepID=A0A947DHX5_9CYAN|nr:CRTAC1 family protein [Leptothoe spongobia]MBT9317281.1 CRTAC1 family protein [Leptothoe spongobia TAU-MAC 1115]